MKPVRLIYLSSTSAGLHDFRFLKQLKKLEPEFTTVFATYRPKLVEASRQLGINSVNLNPHNLPIDDWNRQGLYNFWRRYRLRYYFTKHIEALKRLQAEFKPDIVHSGWLQTDSYIASRAKIAPLVVMPWGTDILLRPFDNRCNFKKTRWVLNQADLIQIETQVFQDKVEEITGSSKHQYVKFPWGVDREQFHPGNRDYQLAKPLKIIMLKNFVEVSHLETVVQALTILKNRTVHVHVTLYGDGPLRPALERQTSAAGLMDYLSMPGHLPNEQVANELRKHDVYLSCNASEGTSLAMMEAMSCGVLPVVTELPAYREWIVHEDNGLLFPVGNAERLAELLELIMKRGTTWAEPMRLKNLQIAQEEFDWDKNFSKLVQAYKSLL